MVRALIRHLRGEPEACSVIRVPSPEQEDARRLHRERDRLIAGASRTSIVLRASAPPRASMITRRCAAIV
jgi:transposase